MTEGASEACSFTRKNNLMSHNCFITWNLWQQELAALHGTTTAGTVPGVSIAHFPFSARPGKIKRSPHATKIFVTELRFA